MALPLALAATSTVAAAAYLNAKYHIRKDLNILYVMKATEKVFRKAAMEKKASLWYAFEAACLEKPNNLLIWSRERTYTRRDVFQISCKYGNYLLEQGARPGDMVALYHMNAPEFMFMWLGLWSIGCVPAMINYNLAAESLEHCVSISNAKIIMVDQDQACQDRVNGSRQKLQDEMGVKTIVLDTELKAQIAGSRFKRPSNELRNVVNYPRFPIALFYTSGTTGLPKAFPFETVRLYPLNVSSKSPLSLDGDNDMWYNCMPLYHGTGGVIAIGSMMRGVALAVGKRFSVTNFWEDIRDSGATAFVYVGETARYLLSAPPSPDDRNHNVRLMYGNGMRPDVWRKFQDRFGVPEVGEFFNSTEGMFNTMVYSRSGFGEGTVGHHGLIFRTLLHPTYVPVATDPLTGDMWRDPSTGFAKRNKYSEGGEMLVKVKSQDDWAGYYRSKAATDKKFIHDVFQKGDIYYKPGDALRRDDDGFWYFMDRLGDTFRWKGENVSTAEVSDVLGNFKDIQEANVYGVALPRHDGRAGCAAVQITPEARADFSWKGLAEYSRSKLPAYAVPMFIRVMSGEAGSMGTHNNKQNKVPLREEGVDPAMKGRKVPSGDSDEVYWLPPKGDSYVPFTPQVWDEINAGKLKL